MSESYDVLRANVDLAVEAWREWLERKGLAEDFAELFHENPYLALLPAEGDEIWSIRLTDEAQKSLDLRLHREERDRIVREKEMEG